MTFRKFKMRLQPISANSLNRGHVIFDMGWVLDPPTALHAPLKSKRTFSYYKKKIDINVNLDIDINAERKGGERSGVGWSGMGW